MRFAADLTQRSGTSSTDLTYSALQQSHPTKSSDRQPGDSAVQSYPPFGPPAQVEIACSYFTADSNGAWLTLQPRPVLVTMGRASPNGVSKKGRSSVYFSEAPAPGATSRRSDRRRRESWWSHNAPRGAKHGSALAAAQTQAGLFLAACAPPATRLDRTTAG